MEPGINFPPESNHARLYNALVKFPEIAREHNPTGKIVLKSAGYSDKGIVVIETETDDDGGEISSEPQSMIFVAEPDRDPEMLRVIDVIDVSGGQRITGLVKIAEDDTKPSDVLYSFFFDANKKRCTEFSRLVLGRGKNISNPEKARDKVMAEGDLGKITDSIRS